MRKIISKHKEKRKKKIKQAVLSLALIFIILSSILGYAFQTFGGDSGNDSNGEDYVPEITNFNGFDFTEQNGFWILDLNGINLIFRYNPSQLLGIENIVNPLLNYEAKPLYVYSEDVQAKSEIKTNLFGFVEKIEDACLENKCEDEQIKTCEDNFILIQESNNQGIRQQDNCVFISGKKEDLVKLTDEFLYKILGVA